MTVPTVSGAVWRLALAAPPTPGAPAPGAPGAERGEEFGKTSPLALVVILVLAVATALLIRSMSKRLRNVPASFEGTDLHGRPVTPTDPGPPAERIDPDPSRRDGGDTAGPGDGPRAGPTGSP